MSTALPVSYCNGTSRCKERASKRCKPCGRELCGRCWTYTTCGPRGHREADEKPAAPKPEPVAAPRPPKPAPIDTPPKPKGKRGPKRDEAKRALVLAALRAGRPTDQIVIELQASPMLIASVRKENGITTRVTTTKPGPKPATTEPTKEKDMPRLLSDEKRTAIEKALRDGASPGEIQKTHHVSWSTADKVRQEIGLPVGPRGGNRSRRVSAAEATTTPKAKPAKVATPGPAPAAKRPTSVELTIRAAAIVECPGCSCAIVLDGQALDRLRAKVS